MATPIMIGNDNDSSMSSHAGMGMRSTAMMHTTKKSAPHPIIVQSTMVACQQSQQANGMIRTASRAVTEALPAGTFPTEEGRFSRASGLSTSSVASRTSIRRRPWC